MKGHIVANEEVPASANKVKEQVNTRNKYNILSQQKENKLQQVDNNQEGTNSKKKKKQVSNTKEWITKSFCQKRWGDRVEHKREEEEEDNFIKEFQKEYY